MRRAGVHCAVALPRRRRRRRCSTPRDSSGIWKRLTPPWQPQAPGGSQRRPDPPHPLAIRRWGGSVRGGKPLTQCQKTSYNHSLFAFRPPETARGPELLAKAAFGSHCREGRAYPASLPERAGRGARKVAHVVDPPRKRRGCLGHFDLGSGQRTMSPARGYMAAKPLLVERVAHSGQFAPDTELDTQE